MLIVVITGVFDDLISIRQWIKTIMQVFAALPLGITGAANEVNMLAGFNGLEVGMGLVKGI